MDKNQSEDCGMINFANRIKYELKRAERYRIFVSFLVFDIGSVLKMIDGPLADDDKARKEFLRSVNSVIRGSVREIDAVSNDDRIKIGVLCPETSRQGAEAAAKRIQTILGNYCTDHFGNSRDYLIPVEISSFPDAAGNRSIASYFEEYDSTN